MVESVMIGRNRARICCHQQLRSYTAETFPGQLALTQASFLLWSKVLIRKEIDLLVMTRPSFFLLNISKTSLRSHLQYVMGRHLNVVDLIAGCIFFNPDIHSVQQQLS